MRSIKTQRLFPYSAIFFMFAVLLIHSQFSFCQSDESFYCALLHRLYLGESLIVDEWHPVQCYSPILLPLYILYKTIVPSGNGVILFFRIVYISVSGISAAVFFMHAKKKYHTLVVLFTSLLVLLYSRANIQGCSYYNLFFQFTLLSVVFLDCAKNKSLRFAFPAGVMAALSSLCNPYLFFLMLPIYIMVLLIWHKSERKLLNRLALGVFLVFGVYILFLLSRATLQELLQNIRFLFHDPSHESTLHDKLIQVSWQAFSLVPESLFFLVIVITVYAFLLGKHRIKFYRRHLITYCGCILLFMLKAVVKSPKSICFGITFPVTLIMFPLYIYRLAQKDFDFPMVLYSAGLLSSAAFFLASDTGLDAMTVGFTISSVAGLLLLESTGKNDDIAEKTINPRNLYRFTVIISLIIVILFGCHRFWGIYRDAPLPELTETLTIGPAAGLKTTPEHAEEYLSLYNAVRSMADGHSEGQVIFGRIVPWMYLCCNWGYGSPSAWNNTVSSERLKDYFELHPNKLPQLVFLVSPDVCSYETVLFNNHAGTNTYNNNPLEGWFWETYLCKSEVVYADRYVSAYCLSCDG